VSAGEEALGILSFFAKALLRVVPIGFGVGTLVGAVGMAIGTFGVLFTGSDSLRHAALLPGKRPLDLIILCTCLPFMSYAFFAFYNLTIDVLRAILVLPEKIDKAGKTRKSSTPKS
jgi:hypothetical protein